VVYRRLSEFRALSVRLRERFPNKRVPALPVIKEGLFTAYGSLLTQLHTYFEEIVSLGPEVSTCDVFTEFLKVNPNDRHYRATADQVLATESVNRRRPSFETKKSSGKSSP